MKTLFIVLIISVSLWSQSTLDNFLPLTGVWENSDGEIYIYEKWERTSDSVFNGISFEISVGDTISFESIQLLKREEDVYYVPTVKNQNQGEAVYFKLISLKDNNAIFENKEHDFPQRIGYDFSTENKLNAYIEGEIKGKMKKITFNFTRKSD